MTKYTQRQIYTYICMYVQKKLHRCVEKSFRWFQELIKKTDDSHPERRSLEKALEAMQVSTVFVQYSGRINYNYLSTSVSFSFGVFWISLIESFCIWLQNNFQDLSLYVNEVKRDDEALQLINEIQHSIVDLAMVRNVSFSSTAAL